jgi:hypothetical protein
MSISLTVGITISRIGSDPISLVFSEITERTPLNGTVDQAAKVKGGGAEDARRPSGYPTMPADLPYRSEPPLSARSRHSARSQTA